MPRIIIKKQAAKALAKLPRRLAVRVRDAIRRIADKDVSGLDIRSLGGTNGLYRLRVGRWRLIYTWSEGQLTLLILKLKPRGDAYK